MQGLAHCHKSEYLKYTLTSALLYYSLVAQAV